jgi:hypothetical protein
MRCDDLCIRCLDGTLLQLAASLFDGGCIDGGQSFAVDGRNCDVIRRLCGSTFLKYLPKTAAAINRVGFVRDGCACQRVTNYKMVRALMMNQCQVMSSRQNNVK